MIISKINMILSQFISFIIIFIIDKIKYIKYKEYKKFNGYGFHVYVGKFGSGKTSAMVRDAYLRAKRFPQLTIMTNMKLMNFPEHTQIIELDTYKQILQAPKDTLILLDELSTIFNSRDWKDDGVPAQLLGLLLQVRKKRIMIYGTAQLFKHVDKLIRDIVFSVRVCKCIAGRWNAVSVYDGLDYETRIGNSVNLPKCEKFYGFIQTNQIRRLYDTTEMVEKMKKSQYISDLETLQNIKG